MVRFFDQRTCYTVHGPDALAVAQQYYRTTAVVKYYGSQQNGLPGETPKIPPSPTPSACAKQ